MANLANVVFIGGASASGKSTSAQELASQTGRPYLELDRLFNSVKDTAGKAGAADQVCKEIAEGVVLEGVRALIESETQWVVEGGWISPVVAADLISDGKFQAVFCGYTNTTPYRRYKAIKSNPNNRHWLASKSETFAVAFLKGQIEGSQWYCSECQKHGLPYFDFSDQADGALNLLEHFLQ